RGLSGSVGVVVGTGRDAVVTADRGTGLSSWQQLRTTICRNGVLAACQRGSGPRGKPANRKKASILSGRCRQTEDPDPERSLDTGLDCGDVRRGPDRCSGGLTRRGWGRLALTGSYLWVAVAF